MILTEVQKHETDTKDSVDGGIHSAHRKLANMNLPPSLILCLVKYIYDWPHSISPWVILEVLHRGDEYDINQCPGKRLAAAELYPSP